MQHFNNIVSNAAATIVDWRLPSDWNIITVDLINWQKPWCIRSSWNGINLSVFLMTFLNTHFYSVVFLNTGEIRLNHLRLSCYYYYFYYCRYYYSHRIWNCNFGFNHFVNFHRIFIWFWIPATVFIQIQASRVIKQKTSTQMSLCLHIHTLSANLPG